MNYANMILCLCSIACSIVAALIAGEILHPIDPVDLSVGLLMTIALFLVYMAANNLKGVANEDKNED